MFAPQGLIFCVAGNIVGGFRPVNIGSLNRY